MDPPRFGGGACPPLPPRQKGEGKKSDFDRKKFDPYDYGHENQILCAHAVIEASDSDEDQTSHHDSKMSKVKVDEHDSKILKVKDDERDSKMIKVKVDERASNIQKVKDDEQESKFLTGEDDEGPLSMATTADPDVAELVGVLRQMGISVQVERHQLKHERQKLQDDSSHSSYEQEKTTTNRNVQNRGKENAVHTEDGVGVYCKNLLLKDKKGQAYLVICHEDTMADMRVVKYHLNVQGNLHLASKDTLMTLMGVQPGAVTPLALYRCQGQGDDEGQGQRKEINPKDPIRVFFDASFAETIDRSSTPLYFHPLRQDLQVALTLNDLERFLQQQCGVALKTIPSLCQYGAKRRYWKPKASDQGRRYRSCVYAEEDTSAVLNSRNDDGSKVEAGSEEKQTGQSKVEFHTPASPTTTATTTVAAAVCQSTVQRELNRPREDHNELLDRQDVNNDEMIGFSAKLMQVFKETGIETEVKLSTTDRLAHAEPSSQDHVIACKCVYLKDKRDNYFLFVCHDAQKVDYSALKMQLKPKKKITPLDGDELSSLLKLSEDYTHPFCLAEVSKPRFLVAVADNLYVKEKAVLEFPFAGASSENSLVHVRVCLKALETFVRATQHDLTTINVKGSLETLSSTSRTATVGAESLSYEEQAQYSDSSQIVTPQAVNDSNFPITDPLQNIYGRQLVSEEDQHWLSETRDDFHAVSLYDSSQAVIHSSNDSVSLNVYSQAGALSSNKAQHLFVDIGDDNEESSQHNSKQISDYTANYNPDLTNQMETTNLFYSATLSLRRWVFRFCQWLGRVLHTHVLQSRIFSAVRGLSFLRFGRSNMITMSESNKENGFVRDRPGCTRMLQQGVESFIQHNGCLEDDGFSAGGRGNSEVREKVNRLQHWIKESGHPIVLSQTNSASLTCLENAQHSSPLSSNLATAQSTYYKHATSHTQFLFQTDCDDNDDDKGDVSKSTKNLQFQADPDDDDDEDDDDVVVSGPELSITSSANGSAERCKVLVFHDCSGCLYYVMCTEDDALHLSRRNLRRLRRAFGARPSFRVASDDVISQRFSWQGGGLTWGRGELSPLVLMELGRLNDVRVGLTGALYYFPDTVLCFDLPSLGVTLTLTSSDLEALLKVKDASVVYFP